MTAQVICDFSLLDNLQDKQAVSVSCSHKRERRKITISKLWSGAPFNFIGKFIMGCGKSA